jgi:hypothetical protein
MTKVQVSFAPASILGVYVTLTKLAFFCSASDLAGTATFRTMKKLKNATKNMELSFFLFKVSRQPGFVVAGDMILLDYSLNSRLFKFVGDA